MIHPESFALIDFLQISTIRTLNSVILRPFFDFSQKTEVKKVSQY